MVFSSMVFIFLYLPITCLLYFAAPGRRAKNLVLLLLSLLFYAWGEPVYLLLMVCSILVNCLLGQKVAENRPVLIIAVLFNLGFLFFFKYAGFAISSLNAFAHTSFTVPTIALPIGISFYTFQALSYIIDVYRKDVPPQKNLIHLALYISLFPQLIAGPIVRYTDVTQQIEERTETLSDFCHGLAQFMLGLAAKVIIANNLAVVADGIFGAITTANTTGASVPALWGWVAVLAYTFQIYFDFSGYSTMAIGLGRMFGFSFIPNFNYPYMATSITGFWRRWHMSLSHWFRDYVYIPMGGNRCSIPRHIFNILTVWMLTGLWHGAAVNFILWGLYYGILLILEKYLFQNLLEKMPTWLTAIITFFLVSLGWVLFRTESATDLVAIMQVLFPPAFSTRQPQIVSTAQWALQHADTVSKSLFLLPAIIFSFPLVPRIKVRLSTFKGGESMGFIICLALFVLSICMLEASTYNPFIYFRF